MPAFQLVSFHLSSNRERDTVAVTRDWAGLETATAAHVTRSSTSQQRSADRQASIRHTDACRATCACCDATPTASLFPFPARRHGQSRRAVHEPGHLHLHPRVRDSRPAPHQQIARSAVWQRAQPAVGQLPHACQRIRRTHLSASFRPAALPRRVETATAGCAELRKGAQPDCDTTRRGRCTEAQSNNEHDVGRQRCFGQEPSEV